MRRLLLLLAVLTLAAGAVIWGVGAWFLTPPAKPWISSAPPGDSKEVTFAASDGVQLKGWWWPAGERADAVLLLHGLGGDRRDMVPRATWLHAEGYAVLLFDFRGCGESSGRGTFGFSERLDVTAALGFLKAHSDKVVILARQTGAVAAVMAVDDWQAVRAAVLEQLPDTFENGMRGRVRRGVGWLEPLVSVLALKQVRFRLGFDPEEVAPAFRLPRAPCPVFLGFGARDETLPPAVQAALFRAGPYPTTIWMLQKAGNQDLYDFDPAAYRKKLGEFLGPALRPEGEVKP